MKPQRVISENLVFSVDRMTTTMVLILLCSFFGLATITIFRPNHSTNDLIFVIRRRQELVRKKRIPLYVCFIDLTKAYDSVDGTFLFWTVLGPFWRVKKNDLSHSSIPR